MEKATKAAVAFLIGVVILGVVAIGVMATPAGEEHNEVITEEAVETTK